MYRSVFWFICAFFLLYGCGFKSLKESAKQGDPEAQYWLAVRYDTGLGVGIPQDTEEAIKLYRASAEQGYAKAQHSMGYLYQFSEGVPQDYQQAATWYRKAADQGYACSINNLAQMYDHGLGFPEENRRAAKMYEEAAEQCEYNAMYNLGILFMEGQTGVEQNYIEAYKWLYLAWVYSKESRDMNIKWPAVEALEELVNMMSEKQIDAANKRFRVWYKSHSSNCEQHPC